MIELRNRYRYLLDGFEHFRFTDEQVTEAMGPFESCLHDIECCRQCDGTVCKTTANRRAKTNWKTGEITGWEYGFAGGNYYYTLSPKGTALYGHPCFMLHVCPGVVERKEQVYAIYRRVSNHEKKYAAANISTKG